MVRRLCRFLPGVIISREIVYLYGGRQATSEILSKKSGQPMHRLFPATRIAGRRVANIPSRRYAFTPWSHPRVATYPTTATSASTPAHSSFHTSASCRDEVPKSPFQVFKEVLSEEIKKNRELEQNVAQLKGEVGKVQDSETLKQARQAYERARVECLLFPSLEERGGVLTAFLVLFSS